MKHQCFPKINDRFKKYILYAFLFLIGIISIKISGILEILQERDFIEFQFPYVDNITYLHGKRLFKFEPFNDFPYRFVNIPEEKCRTKNLTLLILIKSHTENFERRSTIRKTWGRETSGIKRVFLLGIHAYNWNLQKKIDEEAKKYLDILQGDFEDVYFNNTIKTMMGFKWVRNFCNKNIHYVFSDDDYYISIKNVLHYVRNPFTYPNEIKMKMEENYIKKLYAGYVFDIRPSRSYFSKWKLDINEYPYNKLPKFITGGMYILSQSSLLELYRTSFYMKKFRFDDVYLAILAIHSNIHRLHNEEFHFYKLKYNKYEYKHVIGSHGYGDPKELLSVWNEQNFVGHA